MYNPAKFQSSDINEIFELMDRNPFATLISVADDRPFVSHLPLTPKKIGDEIYLIGHLATANPHHRLLKTGPVTVIFHGAHTYITPKWYAENNVPTWNYSVVHVSGQATLIENQESIIECLKELTNHAERHWSSGWDFFIPDDLVGDSLVKYIIGFKIKITEIDFKKKLSQNRTAADRAGVLKGLGGREDDGSRGVRTDMLKIYSEGGEKK